MKTEPRRFRTRLLQSTCWIAVLAATLLIPFIVHADGIFVVPKFVWDKHKDINEPTQKAIIAYDSGREDLILQVKYDGPVDEFGWLIPVPNMPTVKEGSMECFYELSKYTQRKFEFESSALPGAASMSAGQGIAEPPPVTVVEVKTVGAYRIAVLSAREAGALEKWLEQNDFSIPEDKAGIIDSYVKQGWYFVAARINLGKVDGFEEISGAPRTGANTKSVIAEKLSSGELHPLHLSFASDNCVFPLKISSINGRPSEVQVYLLSTEPLIEKGLFRQKLVAQHEWRTNTLANFKRSENNLQIMRGGLMPGRPSDDYLLSMRTWINSGELVPYAQVGRMELPVCASAVSLPGKASRWLTKQTWKFTPEEMRDLEFEPALPVFSAALGDEEGAFAAANLARLGHIGVSALLAATQSTNPRVRANAMSAVEDRRFSDADSATGREIAKQLPALLKDPDPEVRLRAIITALNIEKPIFFEQAVDLLRDDNPEVAEQALSYLGRQREEAAKHIPLFKEMLRDTNSTVQTAGLRGLFYARVDIPREDLIPLLSVPRSEVVALSYQILDKKGITDEETKLLLKNPVLLARLIGLKILVQKNDKESIELAIPLLSDSEQIVRVRALGLLEDLTGQSFPIDAPDQWRKWWDMNKSTFVIDQEQIQQRRAERLRQRREAIRRSNSSPASDQ